LGHRVGDMKMRIKTPEMKIREKRIRRFLRDIPTIAHPNISMGNSSSYVLSMRACNVV